MYCDFVLANKDCELEVFAKKLGFNKLFFKEDFSKLGLVEFTNYDDARKLIEGKKIKILVNPQVNNYKDGFYFRGGGLDHVICNLARKNGVAVGFSLDSINSSVMIGRIKQDIKLCKKYGVRVLFFTFAKDKYGLKGVQDLLSLLRILGMNGKEANQALSYC